jgi:hypothetical protein
VGSARPLTIEAGWLCLELVIGVRSKYVAISSSTKRWMRALDPHTINVGLKWSMKSDIENLARPKSGGP